MIIGDLSRKNPSYIEIKTQLRNKKEETRAALIMIKVQYALSYWQQIHPKNAILSGKCQMFSAGIFLHGRTRNKTVITRQMTVVPPRMETTTIKEDEVDSERLRVCAASF